MITFTKFKEFEWWNIKVIPVLKYKQKQPPEVFYKKGVLRNFVKFRG